MVKPIKFVAEREVTRKGNSIKQVLVEWSNSGGDDRTWEDWNSVKDFELGVNLEDKVESVGGGNVTDPMITGVQVVDAEPAGEVAVHGPTQTRIPRIKKPNKLDEFIYYQLQLKLVL